MGQLAADRLGTHHTFMPIKPLVEGDRHSNGTVRNWLDSPEYLAYRPARPRVIWSGDGGSVGVGHVYLNADIVAATRRGELEHAADLFMSYNGRRFPYKLLKETVAQNLEKHALDGMVSEMKDLKPADMGRVSHLFLMLNDQRRHLFNHFENLDMARIEFELPFFDAEFLTTILSENIDPFLRHAFYLDWLQCFPPGVGETPWQAYPNHVPCPLPIPQGLAYQWDEATKISQRTPAGLAMAQARSLAKERRFAREFLSSGRMRVFMALLFLRRNEYGYLLEAPKKLHSYWKSSDGFARTPSSVHQQKAH